VLSRTCGEFNFLAEDLGEGAIENIAQPIHVLRVAE
jgi:hypothetical protein